MPGRLMSKVYLALPEAFAGPSMREMRLPIKLRLSASGHLYSAIASPSSQILGRLCNRRFHPDIASAATGIAAHVLGDQFRRRIGMLGEEGRAGHHKARRAEAALLSVVVHERLLHRTQCAV